MISRAGFGRHPSGRAVDAITCTNANGISVEFLSYGGIIRTLFTSDRNGVPGDIVLGYDTLDEYLKNPFYFGAIIGRNANRITRGHLAIDGHEYALTINNPPNNLHGGVLGLHQVLWDVEPFDHASACGAVLSCTSHAGDDGYPGTVHTRVTYTLRDDDTFEIAYEASTDAPTPVNLTQHSYFNLSGVRGANVLQHELEIAASRYTPVDSTLIPLGAHADVSGTPFDFRTARAIGREIAADDEQLRPGGGYDHNWVLDGGGATVENDSPRLAARLSDPASGRTLEVRTTEPGIQVYAGGTLDAGLTGKHGAPYPRYAGIALETQHFPDAPNQSGYPSTILRPGETYTSRTVWRFSNRS